MARSLICRPTQKRIEWLETLEREGSARRPSRSPVGFECMSLGWTRWTDPDNDDFTEVLTDEGRRVLADWRTS